MVIVMDGLLLRVALPRRIPRPPPTNSSSNLNDARQWSVVSASVSQVYGLQYRELQHKRPLCECHTTYLFSVVLLSTNLTQKPGSLVMAKRRVWQRHAPHSRQRPGPPLQICTGSRYPTSSADQYMEAQTTRTCTRRDAKHPDHAAFFLVASSSPCPTEFRYSHSAPPGSVAATDS